MYKQFKQSKMKGEVTVLSDANGMIYAKYLKQGYVQRFESNTGFWKELYFECGLYKVKTGISKGRLRIYHFSNKELKEARKIYIKQTYESLKRIC